MKSELAKARDKWLESVEGQRCCEGRPEGKYLRNRLECAFIAGWNAAIMTCNEIIEKSVKD